MPLSSFSHSLALRSHHSCFPFASFPILPFLPLHYRSTNDQIQLMLIMLLILADTGNSSGVIFVGQGFDVYLLDTCFLYSLGQVVNWVTTIDCVCCDCLKIKCMFQTKALQEEIINMKHNIC